MSSAAEHGAITHKALSMAVKRSVTLYKVNTQLDTLKSMIQVINGTESESSKIIMSEIESIKNLCREW